jgi:hypothetical protein
MKGSEHQCVSEEETPTPEWEYEVGVLLEVGDQTRVVSWRSDDMDYIESIEKELHKALAGDSFPSGFVDIEDLDREGDLTMRNHRIRVSNIVAVEWRRVPSEASQMVEKAAVARTAVPFRSSGLNILY